jgi:hypothetical protein
MEETRDLWDAWSDAFQAAWNADTDAELPPADVHMGPGLSAEERLDLLPSIDGADAVELSLHTTDVSGRTASNPRHRREHGDIEGRVVVVLP